MQYTIGVTTSNQIAFGVLHLHLSQVIDNTMGFAARQAAMSIVS